jgi:hypothetical protein
LSVSPLASAGLLACALMIRCIAVCSPTAHFASANRAQAAGRHRVSASKHARKERRLCTIKAATVGHCAGRLTSFQACAARGQWLRAAGQWLRAAGQAQPAAAAANPQSAVHCPEHTPFRGVLSSRKRPWWMILTCPINGTSIPAAREQHGV